jgi:hypothetical protein
MQRRGVWCVGLVPARELRVGKARSAAAMPALARRCHPACGACHVAWPELVGRGRHNEQLLSGHGL